MGAQSNQWTMLMPPPADTYYTYVPYDDQPNISKYRLYIIARIFSTERFIRYNNNNKRQQQPEKSIPQKLFSNGGYMQMLNEYRKQQIYLFICRRWAAPGPIFIHHRTSCVPFLAIILFSEWKMFRRKRLRDVYGDGFGLSFDVEIKILRNI